VRFEVPTIRQRGELVRLIAAVQAHKPEHGEHRGQLPCRCGSKVSFTIMANGISWGQCAAACGVKWSN
jgi:hypothetical protein